MSKISPGNASARVKARVTGIKMDNKHIAEEISRLREKLNDDLLILGHHYQDDSVIKHVDFSGDSLELARKSAESNARHIVFCGVHFMAESAATLAREGQAVYLPSDDAQCVMANTAPASLVDAALNALNKTRRVVPLTYVNSSLAVKAVCGCYDGAVCTSANAQKMLEWAFEQGDAVLFIPDKNLARNIGNALGIPEREQFILDVRGHAAALREGRDTEQAGQAKLCIWPGCCAIHARFTPVHIHEMRKQHPGCRVLVHPECTPEVVNLADFAGSTSAMIKAVAAAPEGSVLVVGTEWHLVNRLAHKYAGKKTVIPLFHSICSDMSKTTEQRLLSTLQGINTGTATPISVNPDQVVLARQTLQTMLDVCS